VALWVIDGSSVRRQRRGKTAKLTVKVIAKSREGLTVAGTCLVGSAESRIESWDGNEEGWWRARNLKVLYGPGRKKRHERHVF
jgi:hypothetical protein